MNTRHLLLPLALSLALAAPTAQALGLGQLQVKSGLNQPLVAEIPIISATPAEMDQLTVRLASPDAFARVGLDLPRELTANLQFSVGRNARGQSVVRISTTNKFTEPFLSFLIEADWGKGTVTREYTALIDPPYIAPAVIRPMETATVAAAPIQMPVAPPVQATPAPAPEPAQTMAAAEPEPVSVAPTPEPVTAPPPPMPAPPPQPVVSRPAAPAPAPVRAAPRPATPVPAPVPAPAKPDQYGPVEKGKTLWSIAESVKPDDALTTNQMMLALLRANPEAFDSENINRLKSGSVLRIPGREEVSTLGPAEAAALVQAQASAWRTPPAPVPQPAEAIAERKPVQAPRPASTPADSVASAPKPAPARRPAQSRLEIVPPSGKSTARGSQSGAASGAGGSELRAELVQAKEDLAARTAEVTELKSRVADLDELNQKQQEMIQVQSSEMKALQDRLAELEQAKTSTPAQTVAATPPAAKPADKPAADKPVPAAADAPADEPLYMNPYVLGGAGLLLLIGMVLALRRGRSSPDEEAIPVRRISDDEALRASLAQTRVSVVPEPAAPVAAPAPVPAPAPVKKSPEPRPAEATDRELENLKSAVKSRPQDLEAHLSLLRYYHSHRQTAEYEAAAQIMRLQVPSTMDPRWREAVVMGAALLPGHPLFSQAGWNAPQFNESSTAAPKPTPEPVAKAAAPAVVAPVAAVGSAAAADAHADSNDWDRLVAQAGGTPENLTDIDLSVPDFGVDTPKDVHRAEAEVLAEDEASATRIELAKAYLDIGDLDGARSMLEEVLIDGGPAAKAEALRILNELG